MLLEEVPHVQVGSMEGSVRLATFEKIPLSMPPAYCDELVGGKLSFVTAM
jgi:hypothetical protein